MKKIGLFLGMLLFLISCSKNDTTTLLYTTTTFENLSENSGFNNHFDTKKAMGSVVYKLDFINRAQYSQEIFSTSEEKMVYHDFCKFNNTIYAVGGAFGKEYGSAKMIQLYPQTSIQKTYNNGEIRLRDCDVIENNNQKYIGMVSHGTGKLIVLDEQKFDMLTEVNSYYSGTINEKSYTGVSMIHEIISSDLNNDSQKEFYYTVTSENGDTYMDQRGKIFQGYLENGNWKAKEFFDLGEAYSKEIHPITLQNGKEILLVSVQGKTKINEQKDQDTPPQVLFKFKDGTTKTIKNTQKITDIIRPTMLSILYEENGQIKSKNIGNIDVVQCRAVETGKFYQEKQSVGVIVGCNNGLIQMYTLDNNLDFTLKDSFRIPEKQIHSFYVKDTNNDGIDEVFIGVDFEGVYHLDLQDKEKLFKMFDYSQKETWIWAIDEISK